MEVSRSGYYRYAKQPYKKECQRLIIEIRALHLESKRTYGTRRISKALKKNGLKVGRYKIRRLMKEYGIECKLRRRYKVTTQSKHNLPVVENKLNRNFSVPAPNQAWTADITYLWTQEGWLYVAAVLDLFSRRVIGWSVASHMRTTLVENARAMAIGRRNPESGLMHHSDRGSQYASNHYQGVLKKQGIVVSMSRKGNCWDNAVMERFFGSLKSERTDGVKYVTREQAKKDIVDYIEMFYNSSRLHSTLGYLSPMEFEKHRATSL